MPGTNPFFPLLHAYQGNRMLELMKESPMEVYLLNTGRIGGDDKDERSKKVRIQHSSAIVKAIAEGTIKWEKDPDFGYLVATEVPGIDDADYLQPKKMYERQGGSTSTTRWSRSTTTTAARTCGSGRRLSEEIVNAILSTSRDSCDTPVARSHVCSTQPRPALETRAFSFPSLDKLIADRNIDIAICNMTVGEKLRYLRTIEGTLRGLDREMTQQAVFEAIEKELGSRSARRISRRSSAGSAAI